MFRGYVSSWERFSKTSLRWWNIHKKKQRKGNLGSAHNHNFWCILKLSFILGGSPIVSQLSVHVLNHFRALVGTCCIIYFIPGTYPPLDTHLRFELMKEIIDRLTLKIFGSHLRRPSRSFQWKRSDQNDQIVSSNQYPFSHNQGSVAKWGAWKMTLVLSPFGGHNFHFHGYGRKGNLHVFFFAESNILTHEFQHLWVEVVFWTRFLGLA